MSDDLVNIEINGVPCKAHKGEMIIRATDREGAYVPRFCYHEKLAVAANCRMCLVDVEKAPKPLPACATPVAEGMKIFTKSPRAIGAQRATMEFLLINHPLDCPICDQGGECELQDLAVGFGRDISRFTERKRVVPDENLGPLIATDMTRCIHCTRCIRFTEQIAGYQELGMIGRGENMRVRTAVEHTVQHELSGNVIDLCPVGALVSKPYRFTARAWEMTSHPLVSPHDGIGTNLFGHVLRGKLMRVVPRENEEINETWIADRDRFSYEGIYSPDRLKSPMVREGAEWKAVDWETALNHVAKNLREQASSLGVLASTSSTVEELYLLGRLTRALGSQNIDHRLRQRDFRDQAADPLHPSLGLPIAQVERLDALLLVGCNPRREAPILAHRIRKAAQRGAKISFVNPARFEFLFPIAAYLESAPASQVNDLAAILSAVTGGGAEQVPVHLADAVRNAKVEETHRAVAMQLLSGEKRAVLLGALALRHPAFADLRALGAAIAQAIGGTFGVLAEGGNAAGAYLAGAVPHREAGGRPIAQPGLTAAEMLKKPLGAYVLFGGVEPWVDALDSEVTRTLAAAKFVVAMTPFESETLREVAHVMLPIGTFAETSGTFVNLEGRWQSYAGAAQPVGEARPGWKVLRVLGNVLNLDGFEYLSSEEVRDELRRACADAQVAPYAGSHRVNGAPAAAPIVELNMYQADALVRRAPALQKTREGRTPPAHY
ncbi:MAG: NADH-quinone oxidoreductase subunit G [Steroidobacteraceae bacterium]|nr:NADH-quinone oxidoreductase subunit G [Steroidobacteraceae bacterium]